MIEIIITAFLVLFVGFCDRVRGGYPKGRPKWVGYLARFAVGSSFAFLLAPDVIWIYAALGAGVMLLSWRQDNGWRGKWVRNDLDKSWKQPVQWGGFWSIPFVLFSFWHPTLLVMLPASIVGALIAINIAVKLPSLGDDPRTTPLGLVHAWAWSELIELPIIAIIALSLNALAVSV